MLQALASLDVLVAFHNSLDTKHLSIDRPVKEVVQAVAFAEEEMCGFLLACHKNDVAVVGESQSAIVPFVLSINRAYNGNIFAYQ